MDEAPKPKKIERISKTTAILMVGSCATIEVTCSIIDLLLDIIAIGYLSECVKPFLWIIYFIWFKMHGVSFATKTKNFTAVLVTEIISIIPYVNILPPTTVGVLRVIMVTKAEDKLKSAASAVPLASKVASMAKAAHGSKQTASMTTAQIRELRARDHNLNKEGKIHNPNSGSGLTKEQQESKDAYIRANKNIDGENYGKLQGRPMFKPSKEVSAYRDNLLRQSAGREANI